MATPASRTQVLSLYRDFIRYGNKLSSYNFRSYAVRRSRDAFRAHADESDATKIASLINRGKQDLEVVKRQAIISTLYSSGQKLVIEKPVAPRSA
ncbi:hypothetical protein BDB00DRAFT_757125 [Zychaea mexicana]|uniref:uncharacterized protein n=1 Tax=Zychaea mexicana TaxID=64656 RepID=UPI0022FEA0B1|nr:uncharacterized protein BDB00DRAFT_757125 [Zychaea mexicana]KAI9497278.1 hypothetical protein BDB00DRAFT_757125 [Zychaea mexicana]